MVKYFGKHPHGHCVISDKYKVIFITIPKNASSIMSYYITQKLDGRESNYFDCTKEEKKDIWNLVEQVKTELDQQFNPDGYNIGINCGAAAGQTISHLHIHIIPRYNGDVADPSGGVRGVIPKKQKY